MKLNSNDERTFDALRAAGVLRDIHELSVDVSNGVIHSFCGDCDERGEMEFCFECLCHQQTERPRIHALALNGGPLLIPSGSPLVRKSFGVDRVMIQQIREAARLKSIPSVVLQGHAVCGAATDHDLSLLETIGLLVEARAKVKNLLPQLQGVELLFYVRHCDDRTRTYRIATEAWTDLPRHCL